MASAMIAVIIQVVKPKNVWSWTAACLRIDRQSQERHGTDPTVEEPTHVIQDIAREQQTAEACHEQIHTL